jgi:predicted naringenin-chalcone synthase
MSQPQALRVAETLSGCTGEQGTWLPGIYGGTGIQQRHMVLSAEIMHDVLNHTRSSQSVFLPSSEPNDLGPSTGQRMQHYVKYAGALANEAAARALANAGIAAKVITHLVTVSCTGFNAPGVDIGLMHALGLPPTTQRTHVGYMGCHGALNGLRVAHAYAGANPRACILLCAVELCSLHYFYGWDPQKMVANALFADGAAAVVGTLAEQTDEWQLNASGSFVFPGTADAMTWTIADHGFEMTLAKQVPTLIGAHLRPWLESWLQSHQLQLKDVASWAIHPGGPRILSAVEETIGVPAGGARDSRAVFAEYGNMSSPTILFILERMRQSQAPRPCVALAFGPGLTVEAALFR